jgi:hypothetical protein
VQLSWTGYATSLCLLHKRCFTYEQFIQEVSSNRTGRCTTILQPQFTTPQTSNPDDNFSAYFLHLNSTCRDVRGERAVWRTGVYFTKPLVVGLRTRDSFFLSRMVAAGKQIKCYWLKNSLRDELTVTVFGLHGTCRGHASSPLKLTC